MGNSLSHLDDLLEKVIPTDAYVTGSSDKSLHKASVINAGKIVFQPYATK